jgi:hypothetical protein
VRELLAEMRDVLQDLAAFVTAPLYRRRHQRWGARSTELAECTERYAG